MATSFTQRGGARVGSSFWASSNATWPLAEITVEADRIGLIVSYLIVKRRYSFAPSRVRRLSVYAGLFSRGLRIEHAVADYPPFVLFWTFNLPQLIAALGQHGLHVEPH